MGNKVNWEELRKLLPATYNYRHLNTAGRAPVSKPVADAAKRYYDQALEHGNILWDDWLGEIDELRGFVAKLINAEKRNLAFIPNSSLGINYVADMHRLKTGVLLSADEFPSSSLPWLQRGYKVEFVKSAPDGTIKVEDFERARRPDSGLLVLSHVQYKTGFRHDLEQIGKYCKENGLKFLVDCTQSAGAFSIDVKKSNIDYLVASGYKWLNAGCGTAIFYVADDNIDTKLFPAVGWRSAKVPYNMVNDELDLEPAASALEIGHPSFVTMFAMGTAIKHNYQIGVENIQARILELVDYLRRNLSKSNFDILSADAPESRSGITILRMENAEEVVGKLEAEKILVAKRGEGIRVSLYYYNTFEDIDVLIDALSKMQRPS